MPDIACLTVDLFCRQSQSLKAKRQIIRSFKDRLRAHHNVSVAEVEFQDSKKRARLAIAMVSADAQYLQGAMDILRAKLPALAHGAEIGRVDLEWFYAGEEGGDPGPGIDIDWSAYPDDA